MMNKHHTQAVVLLGVLLAAQQAWCQVTITRDDVFAWEGNTYLYTLGPRDSLSDVSVAMSEGAYWDFSGIVLSDTGKGTVRAPTAAESAQFATATSIVTELSCRATGCVFDTTALALSVGQDSVRHVGRFRIRSDGSLYEILDGGEFAYSLPLPASQGSAFSHNNTAENYWVDDAFIGEGTVKMPGGEAVPVLIRRVRIGYDINGMYLVAYSIVCYSKEYGIVAMVTGTRMDGDSTFFRPGTTVNLQNFWSNTTAGGREFRVKMGVAQSIGLGKVGASISTPNSSEAALHDLLGRTYRRHGKSSAAVTVGATEAGQTLVKDSRR